MYTTKKETKSNGQITESTTLSRTPSRTPTEVITAGGITYRLIDAQFSRSVLTDPKPGINYNAGEFYTKKVYAVGAATLNNPNTITVDMYGKLYAYDQFWSSTQTQKINVLIEANLTGNNGPVKWGGAAEVIASNARRNKLQYSVNEPYQISFDGGYVKSTWDESSLSYTARLPEFDSNNNPTDVIKTYSDTRSLSSAIETQRLMVPDLKHIRGFWAEEPIKILYSLEVILEQEPISKSASMTRAEFVTMLTNALKDIPVDPNVRTVTVVRRQTKATAPEISPSMM